MQKGPRKLNAPIGRDPVTGQTMTVRSVLLDWLGKGYPQGVAVGRAGISTRTMANWLNRGAAVEQRLAIDPKAKLTPEDRDLLVFVRQVDEVVARAHGRYWEKVDQLAMGGLTRSRIIAKTERRPNAQGVLENVEVERTQIIEQILPSLSALRYVLEQQYNHRHTAEDRDELIPDDEAARHLGDAMEDWLAIRDADAPPVSVNGNGHAETH